MKSIIIIFIIIISFYTPAFANPLNCDLNMSMNGLIEELKIDIGVSTIMKLDDIDELSKNEFNNSKKNNTCPGVVTAGPYTDVFVLVKKDNEIILVSGKALDSENNPWRLQEIAVYKNIIPFLVKSNYQETVTNRKGSSEVKTYDLIEIVSPQNFSYILYPRRLRNLPSKNK